MSSARFTWVPQDLHGTGSAGFTWDGFGRDVGCSSQGHVMRGSDRVSLDSGRGKGGASWQTPLSFIWTEHLWPQGEWWGCILNGQTAL